MLFNTNIQRKVFYLYKNDRHQYNIQTYRYVTIVDRKNHLMKIDLYPQHFLILCCYLSQKWRFLLSKKGF